MFELVKKLRVFDRGPLIHEYVQSHGAGRHIQYNLSTGDLHVVGEAGHGLDYWGNNGNFWWCSFGAPQSYPLLCFVMREATIAGEQDGSNRPNSLLGGYQDTSKYNVLNVQPLRSGMTYVRSTVTGTEFPTNYMEIDDGSLKHFLYQKVDKQLYVAVMASEIESQMDANAHHYGHGDNDVRIDIAFKANIQISPDNLSWLMRLGDQSRPYKTIHMHNF